LGGAAAVGDILSMHSGLQCASLRGLTNASGMHIIPTLSGSFETLTSLHVGGVPATQRRLILNWVCYFLPSFTSLLDLSINYAKSFMMDEEGEISPLPPISGGTSHHRLSWKMGKPSFGLRSLALANCGLFEEDIRILLGCSKSSLRSLQLYSLPIPVDGWSRIVEDFGSTLTHFGRNYVNGSNGAFSSTLPTRSFLSTIGAHMPRLRTFSLYVGGSKPTPFPALGLDKTFFLSLPLNLRLFRLFLLDHGKEVYSPSAVRKLLEVKDVTTPTLDVVVWRPGQNPDHVDEAAVTLLEDVDLERRF